MRILKAKRPLHSDRNRISPSNRAVPTRLDRDTARALVDAGLMPLCEYVRMFGSDADQSQESNPYNLTDR